MLGFRRFFYFDGIAHGIAHLYIVDNNLSWRPNSPFVDVIIECSKKKKRFQCITFILYYLKTCDRIIFWLSGDELQSWFKSCSMVVLQNSGL